MPEPAAGQQRPDATPAQPPGAAPPPPLPPAVRGELLDPSAWRDGLERFARATNLAVALADADGRLLGGCINPRPTWRLLRAGRPEAGPGECPFALLPPRPCACVAAALAGGGCCCVASDRTGLVHFAVPLVLGGHRLGALMAGQVFDHYPEQLALEHAAGKLGARAAEVWQLARLEQPVKQATLRVYADLLATLGETFLQTRYHTLGEAARLGELRRAQEGLRAANDELERRVEQRTLALKAAQEKALQAERLAAVGQMVAGLAHESRNALQRGQACLEMLAMQVQDSPRALDLIARLQQAQNHLHQVYEEVGNYAAPLRLQRGPCDLAEVWRGAWAQLELARQGRRAQLREECGGADLRCVADAFRLGQVFRIVLENALAACPDPVEVTVACSAADLGGREAVRVAVCDSGPGLGPEQLGRMFEPFYTTKTRGTGLGLAIARRIVEAHGGQITARQDSCPGAEIQITLPRGEDRT